jgi:hypothetical protein
VARHNSLHLALGAAFAFSRRFERPESMANVTDAVADQMTADWAAAAAERAGKALLAAAAAAPTTRCRAFKRPAIVSRHVQPTPAYTRHATLLLLRVR